MFNSTQTVSRRLVLSVAKSFDLLKHYPDRWRELREIQVIADTDLIPCVPPDELRESVPLYFPVQEDNIYSHSDFKAFTHDELAAYEHSDISGYTEEGIVEAVTEVHTLKHLWDCIEQELNNSFIIPFDDNAGADEYACSRWERMLGITPAQDATLDERQFIIYVKLYQGAPYSIKKLQIILDGILGEGETAIVRDVGDKTLHIILDLSSRFKNEAVKELLDNIVPADMILNTSIAYTTYDNMANHTHDELSNYTHSEIIVTEL